jgi:hypothetical protein
VIDRRFEIAASDGDTMQSLIGAMLFKASAMAFASYPKARLRQHYPKTNPPRYAERRYWGTSLQDPPRTTRRLQAPLVQAEPLVGSTAEEYVKANTGWSKRTEPGDKSS